ncbi:hypothetical protein L0Y59_00530 [Candidatus Uhrbacteria bacterium]|nr:hypothetical protein [Candidatus Uhrbacteria bacterium]
MSEQTPPTKAAKPVFGKNFFVVLSAVAGFTLIVILLTAFAVAKSGVIEVPLFSRLYRGPEPTRIVTPTVMTAEAFRVLVSSRLISKAVQGIEPPYALSITESEMTGGLDAVIAYALRDEEWKATAVQMAATPGYLEFHGKFRRGPFRVDTRVRFRPIVEDGGVRFEPIDIRVGDYPIHPSVVRTVAGIIFLRDLGTWVLRFGEASLQEVILEDGTVDLVAYPKT